MHKNWDVYHLSTTYRLVVPRRQAILEDHGEAEWAVEIHRILGAMSKSGDQAMYRNANYTIE
jgi:hypothetical protein